MHDLKQLTKDATGILAPDFYIEARVGRENHRGDCVRALSYWASRNERADELLKRLAAFVRDLTDETPADEGWLAKVSPRLADGRCIFIWNAHLLEYDDDFDILSLRAPYTRGRVRLFALGMGLTLREDGR